jgi:TrbL/VirB6 plasmid conjugal transfer protein
MVPPIKWLLTATAITLGVSAAPAQAQGLGLGSLGAINYVTQIQGVVDNMVSTHIDLFLAEGQGLFNGLAAIMLVYMLILALFSKHVAAEKLVEFIFLYLTTYSMLAFYDSPLPWLSSSSVHSIFADEARWIDGMIDLSILNTLAATLKNLIDNAQAPVGFDIVGFLSYGFFVVDIILLWIFSFGLTAASYVALAVGAMLGPLFIPFLIWPFMSFLFTGWLRYMFIYSLWRVMVTAVVAIFANISMSFITMVIGGDLSTGHIMAIVPAWTTLNIVCLYVLWISHSLARDMISGSASMGNALSVAAGAVSAAIIK